MSDCNRVYDEVHTFMSHHRCWHLLRHGSLSMGRCDVRCIRIGMQNKVHAVMHHSRRVQSSSVKASNDIEVSAIIV